MYLGESASPYFVCHIHPIKYYCVNYKYCINITCLLYYHPLLVITFIVTTRPGFGDPSQTILPTDAFGESEVEEIVALGFTREQVSCLQSSGTIVVNSFRFLCLPFIWQNFVFREKKLRSKKYVILNISRSNGLSSGTIRAEAD